MESPALRAARLRFARCAGQEPFAASCFDQTRRGFGRLGTPREIFHAPPRTAAFVALTLSALLIPAAALAVDAPRTTAEPTTTGSAGGIPPAPVGHRQPRAADVPDESRADSSIARGSDVWINGINRDIDRRLFICRGC